jgi:hypothetical protein
MFRGFSPAVSRAFLFSSGIGTQSKKARKRRSCPGFFRFVHFPGGTEKIFSSGAFRRKNRFEKIRSEKIKGPVEFRGRLSVGIPNRESAGGPGISFRPGGGGGAPGKNQFSSLWR